jgi:hypothetical protein
LKKKKREKERRFARGTIKGPMNATPKLRGQLFDDFTVGTQSDDGIIREGKHPTTATKTAA